MEIITNPTPKSCAIVGHGNTAARIMLIADGATDGDMRSGYALSGDRERKFRSFAKDAGFAWEELWVTALIKEKINLKDPKANTKLLTQYYKDILLGEINEIRPNILVPLSELAFHYLTGLHGIRKFRGSLLSASPVLPLFRRDVRVLPTLGPDPYLYEDAKLDFITRLDFTKVRRHADATGPIAEIGNCWWAKTGGQFAEFVARHLDRTIRSGGFVVFDIETFANIPTCISFCFDGEESCCAPLLDWNITATDRAFMLSCILRVLASPIRKVNQNIKFDWRKLARLGITVNNVAGDTMLAFGLLYSEFPKNLGFQTSLYTDIPYFKDEGKEFDPSKYKREQLYIYNAKDSLATHQIYSQQEVEIKEKGVQKVYDKIIEILPIYKRMEETGILVDDTRRVQLLAYYKSLYGIHCLKLQKLCGRVVNPLSSKQMQALVYDELGWEVVRGVKHSKKSGKPSADEESLEILLWSSHCRISAGRPILKTIIDCRKIHKCIEFLELPSYPDGRQRCEFNLAGTETGRTTGGETTDYYLYYDNGKVKLGNMGHSFQTIGKHGFVVDGAEYGKNLRSIFVPSPGFVFVECDLSQAEARVDAVLARDFDILKIFDSTTGIHRLTGSWVYDCSPSDIKKNILTQSAQGVWEDRYHVAKTVRHAGERNMTASRLLMMILQERNVCEKILTKFHKNQPNIRNVFHREIREQIQRDRCLVAPNGRRRDFYGRIDESTINEGISFLPQAIVTDYMKWHLPQTFGEFRDVARPLSEAHDGFLAEVRSEKKEEYAAAFKKNVEVGIDFRTCSLSRDFELVIPAEAEWSDTNWEEMRKL